MPLGPHLGLTWLCDGGGRTRCVAVAPRSAASPLYDPTDEDRWFVVKACSTHEEKLSVTPLEAVFPPPDAEEPERELPVTLLIVEERSFLQEVGPDWDLVNDRLRNGDRLALVYGDARFPGYRFIVFVKPGSTF